MKTWIPLVLIALFLAAPVSAQIEFPASWAGVWEITSTDYTCGNSTPDTMYTEIDTLCAGESFDPGQEEGGFEYQCSGGIDDTSLNVTCSVSGELFPGCTVTFSFNPIATRTGDSFSGTDTFSITYVGDCFGLEDVCSESVVTGTRIGPEPAECSTVPTLPATWGRIKSLYE